MKRFVGVAVVAASLVTLAATRPPTQETSESSRFDLAAFDIRDPDLGASTLVVEPEAGRATDVGAALADKGVAVRRVVAGLLEVDAGAASLEEVLGTPGVLGAGPAARAVKTATPAPVSEPAAVGFGFGGEGVNDVGAPRWHEAGILGAGVTVAVIDTGFGDWDIATAAGEVPVVLSEDIDLCDGGLSGTNHGTATSEIVYDMAPAATLMRVCVDDATDLAQAVPLLIERGVDVVNMSLGFFNTGPGDGSGGPGSPDASARQAIEAGIVWVNSAGNEALVHNAGLFTDTDGNGGHEWAAGDEYIRFDLPPLATVDVYVKWDEWTGAPADDFAVCITNDPLNPGTCLASRVVDRGVPTASLGVRNPFDQTVSLYARIERRAGTGSPRLDTFFLGASAIEYPQPGGSLADPAAVEGVVTVGAYCTRDGRDIRPYSSQGPTLDGRPGVSLIAPGSVSGLLFGDVVGCQGGYGGTSAAAPHVAGAAALVSDDLSRLRAERPVTSTDIVTQLYRRTDRLGEGAPDPAIGFGRLSMGTPLSSPGGPPSTTTTTTAPPTSSTVPPTTTTTPPTTTEPPTTGPPSTTEPPTTVPGTVPPTTTAPPPGPGEPNPPVADDFAFAVSDSPSRSGARPLAGATLSGEAYVFLTPVYPQSAIDHVRFSVDGRLVQVERDAGYDLGGGQANRAYAFDTWRVGDGDHELEAVVVLADGGRYVLRAPFRVDNGGQPRPAQPFVLAYSGGTAAAPLDGATVSGPVTLSLVGADGALGATVHHVLFYVDAVQRGYDQFTPYQSGAVDLGTLGAGAHASQVVVFLDDGRILTVNASFTVA